MNMAEDFVREIKALEKSGAGLPFLFTPVQAFTLLSVLQLALRHPNMEDGSAVAAAFARDLAGNIEERLCVSPALKEIARRGWLREYDDQTPDGRTV